MRRGTIERSVPGSEDDTKSKAGRSGDDAEHRRMLTPWMYIRAGSVVLLVAVLAVFAARRKEPPVVLASAGEAGTIGGAVTNAVKSLAALTLDSDSASGRSLDASYAAEGLRRLAEALRALRRRDSAASLGDCVPDEIGRLADRLERDPEGSTQAALARFAFVMVANAVTDLQRDRYPDLDRDVRLLARTG